MKINNNKILDGNLLIAEFMGAKIDIKTKDCDDPVYEFEFSPNKFNFPYKRYHKEWFSGSRKHSESEERYDNSWNWLMPVVKKLESLQENKEKFFITNSNISNVWNCVIEYLKHKK